jgi:aromatic ring-cleaving dioxygenase
MSLRSSTIAFISLAFAVLLLVPSTSNALRTNPASATTRAGMSSSETSFGNGITHFDVHLYYLANDAGSSASALAVWQRTKELFPHLRLFDPVDHPVGPHPVAMWELHLQNPTDFGTYLAWLSLNRQGHSVLIHPNSGHLVADHTTNAYWLGDKFPLNVALLERYASR